MAEVPVKCNITLFCYRSVCLDINKEYPDYFIHLDIYEGFGSSFATLQRDKFPIQKLMK